MGGGCGACSWTDALLEEVKEKKEASLTSSSMAQPRRRGQQTEETASRNRMCHLLRTHADRRDWLNAYKVFEEGSHTASATSEKPKSSQPYSDTAWGLYTYERHAEAHAVIERAREEGLELSYIMARILKGMKERDEKGLMESLLQPMEEPRVYIVGGAGGGGGGGRKGKEGK